MYTLRRTSTAPASAIRILIDQPAEDSPDRGLTVGGTFAFEPAGQDGDTAAVSDAAAAAIMGDAGLCKHFECTPPWTDPKKKAEPADRPAVKTEAPRRTGRPDPGE